MASSKKLFVLIGGIVFLIVLLSYYYQPFRGLGGIVYLTLVKPGQATHLYSLDLKSQELEKVFDQSKTLEFTGRINTQQTKLAYTGVSDIPSFKQADFRSRKDFQLRQVMIYDLQTRETKQLTDTKTSSKRIVSWSPDGNRVAYIEQVPGRVVDGSNNYTDLSTWQIEIVSMDGSRESIGTGVNPIWSPDGKQILFLEGRGLTLYDVEKKSRESIFPVVGGEASMSMKFDVSTDGTRLVWSIPSQKKIAVYNITSWTPFHMELDKNYFLEGGALFNPVFLSNSNRYVAVTKSLVEIGTQN
ncbi:MAG: hypothetical protein E6R05_04685, partial [Candidatus Moraniibacteriota bacterium]